MGTFSFSSSFFIDFGQLNFVWSALFLFNIYFLLLIRCSLVRARPSSSPCVQALIKRVKSLRSNDIFTFQRFFFTLLARLSVHSLSSRSSRRWFRLPIDKRERERERKITKILTNGSCLLLILVVLLHFLHLSLSLVRLVFTSHSFRECYFLCDGSNRSKKWFPYSSLLLLLLLLSRPSFCSDVV